MTTSFSLDEVLAMAEQIERNGARFYRRAAELTDDVQVKAALLKLAAWEDGHEQTFGRMRRELTPAELSLPAFDPEGTGEMYLRAIADQQVFGPGADPDTWLRDVEGPAAVLKLAVQFERDAIVFFLGMREAVPERLGRGQVTELIDEEVRHVAYLGQELERFASSR